MDANTQEEGIWRKKPRNEPGESQHSNSNNLQRKQGPPQGVIQSKWPKNHGRTEFKRMSNCIRGLERSNRSRMSKKANWI